VISGHLTLAGLIRSELVELERTCAIIARHWAAAPAAADPDAYIGSVALHLHAFYSGAERILEQIARDVDGRVPAGEAWHSELLAQMTIEIRAVRPPVLVRATADRLEAYRRFRYRVRNVYASMLDPGLMAAIVESLPDTMTGLGQDLEAFCLFLETTALADEA
jgi:hypothetical protein